MEIAKKCIQFSAMIFAYVAMLFLPVSVPGAWMMLTCFVAMYVGAAVLLGKRQAYENLQMILTGVIVMFLVDPFSAKGGAIIFLCSLVIANYSFKLFDCFSLKKKPSDTQADEPQSSIGSPK